MVLSGGRFMLHTTDVDLEFSDTFCVFGLVQMSGWVILEVSFINATDGWSRPVVIFYSVCRSLNM